MYPIINALTTTTWDFSAVSQITTAVTSAVTSVLALATQPLPMLCIGFGMIGFGISIVRRLVGMVKRG